MRPYLIAIVSNLVAGSLHYLTNGVGEAPFILYYPAVVVSIIYGNGIVGIVLAPMVNFFVTYLLGDLPSTETLVYRYAFFMTINIAIFPVYILKKKSMERLREYVRIKDNLFAVTSHELRTPLTCLRLKLELRKRKLGDGDPETLRIDEDLNHIDKMVRLVNDILDLNRISKGGYNISPERGELVSIVKGAVDQMLPMIPADRRLTFESGPEKVLGLYDRGRLNQVIVNLIDNSIKYGDGDIVVETNLVGNVANITVRDEGSIPDHVRPTIFERFRRGTSDHNGLGLGLYLSKEIVTLHGGSIRLSSAKATEFVITLPFESKSR